MKSIYTDAIAYQSRASWNESYTHKSNTHVKAAQKKTYNHTKTHTYIYSCYIACVRKSVRFFFLISFRFAVHLLPTECVCASQWNICCILFLFEWTRLKPYYQERQEKHQQRQQQIEWHGTSWLSSKFIICSINIFDYNYVQQLMSISVFSFFLLQIHFIFCHPLCRVFRLLRLFSRF